MADLTIIIVNYKSAGLIRDSLNSFFHQSALTLELIVVDNNSGDEELPLLQEEFPEVIFLNTGYNAGFARANNLGIETSSADYVLLLNPDTIAMGNAIDECYRRLRQSDYIAAGVQLLNEDGSPQISGNYFPPGGLNNLLPLPITGQILKSVALLFNAKSTNVPNADTTIEVDWLNGAFIMVKKSAIEKAGALDNDFFLYAEEIEWCSRLRKLGPLVLYGDLKFTHLQGATANQVFDSGGKGYYNLYDKKGAQILLSNFLRIRKQYGAGWYLVHLTAYLVEAILLGILVPITRMFSRKTLSFALLKGYYKNLSMLLKKTPAILAGKPGFYKV